MPRKQLHFQAPPSAAIAEGATTPNPGILGAAAWSTTLSRTVWWTGSIWTASPSGGTSWLALAGQWSVPPAQIGVTPAGTVYSYSLNDVTRFRLVPSPYVPTQDAFYSSFSAGVLSGLIVSRG